MSGFLDVTVAAGRSAVELSMFVPVFLHHPFGPPSPHPKPP